MGVFSMILLGDTVPLSIPESPDERGAYYLRLELVLTEVFFGG
jgi:hypothetical protein